MKIEMVRRWMDRAACVVLLMSTHISTEPYIPDNGDATPWFDLQGLNR